MFLWALLVVLFVRTSSGHANGALACDLRNVDIGDITYDKNCKDVIDSSKLSISCENCKMPRTKSPQPSTDYTIRSGDTADPSQDTLTYIPDTTMPIYLRTLKFEKLWRGLHLMVSKGETGTAVGRWELPYDLQGDFQVHPNCKGTLTHIRGDVKKARNVFWFSTPPAGTGDINFHTMLKYGFQGEGNFYWPGKPLVLKEGAVGGDAKKPAFGSLYKSGVMQIADTQSSDKGMCFDPNAEKEEENEEEEEEEDDRKPCRTWHGKKSKCESKSRCRWKSSKDKCKDRNAFGEDSSDDVNISAAARFHAPSSWIRFTSLAAGLSFVRSRTSLVVSFGLIMMLQPASAHNWINQASRADPDTDYEGKGCPPKNEGKVHIHVNAGQDFQVEWSVGHGKRGEPHYWRMFYEENIKKAAFASNSVLDNYLKNAPASSKLEGAKYRRIHMGADKRKEFGDAVKDELSEIDSNMIKTRKKTKANDKFKQELSAAQSKNDLRFEHDDNTFIHVSKFPAVNVEYQQDHEFTNMRVPEGTKPGKVILMWNWKGNTDCINIQVYDKSITVDKKLIYAGKKITASGKTEPPTPKTYKFKRIDHCRVPNPTNVRNCRIVTTDVKACMDDCKKAGIESCDAVAVVPAKNPPNKWPFEVLGDGLLPPQCQQLNTQPGDYVCFSVKPVKVGEDKEKRLVFPVRDQLNPGFYSTCFDLVESDDHADGAKAERLEFAFGGQCVSCNDIGPFSYSDTTFIKWEDKLIPEDKCQICP